MDERQRQFAQFAASLNQFAGNNSGHERGPRERTGTDGRSSTGSTSSGSSSIGGNGGNIAAAVAAAAGNAAVWGELNRAFQLGHLPNTPFWSSSHQGGPADFQRYGNYGSYGENEGRNQDCRSESRRVPSKGETKATPPLPPGLTPSRGSKLASLQQLVGLPNEDVYRLIAAQQYAAAFSNIPSSSRQLSPIPHTSHSQLSPGQIHHSRMQNSDVQYNSHYMQRMRQVNSPGASPTSDRYQTSPYPDNINGEYPDHKNEGRKSPFSPKCKDSIEAMGPIEMSPKSQIPMVQSHEMPFPFESEPPLSTSSRISEPRSGSDSESEQKSRHRRKQHQPRRQSVIYGSAMPPHSDNPQSPGSSSDDCDDLVPGIPNENIPVVASTSHSAVTSISSAMSHALSHPFLAPHLNNPDKKYEPPPLPPHLNNPDKYEPPLPKVSLVRESELLDPQSGLLQRDSPPQTDCRDKLSPLPLPDLIPCSQEIDNFSDNKIVDPLDIDPPVKKRKLSQSPDHTNKILKDANLISPSSKTDDSFESQKEDSSKLESPKKTELVQLPSDGEFSSPSETFTKPELVNGLHKAHNIFEDKLADRNKRSTRQKRPVSYVEDETDPILETNDYLMPVLSPTRKRGRRSKEKSDCEPEPSFPSVPGNMDYSEKEFQPDEVISENTKLPQNIPPSFKEPLHIDTNLPSDPQFDPRDTNLPSDPQFDPRDTNLPSDPHFDPRDTNLPSDPQFDPKDTNLPSDPQFDPSQNLNLPNDPTLNQFAPKNPDIYDFNDTDSETNDKCKKKRGRKKSSPRVSEYNRSSPRRSLSRSPKYVPLKPNDKLTSPRNTNVPVQSVTIPNQSVASDPLMINSELDKPIDPLATDDLSLYHEAEKIHDSKEKEEESLCTISPTKLASLCLSTDLGPPNDYSNFNGPQNNYSNYICKSDKRKEPINTSNNNSKEEVICNNKKNKHKKGKKKNNKKSSIKKCTEELISLNPNEMCPTTEPVVNVSVAQVNHVGRKGPTRKKRKRSSFSTRKSSKNNERNRAIENAKSENEPENKPQDEITNHNEVLNSTSKPKRGKNSKSQNDNAETLEDIENFLKQTDPSMSEASEKLDDSLPEKNEPGTSEVNSSLNSETSYKESRPKRISRPPPDLPEGETNDIMFLLNMDGEESDDADYIPKEIKSDTLDSESDSDDDDSKKLALEEEVVKQKKKKPVKTKSKPVEKPVKKENKRVEEKNDRRGPFIKLRTKNGVDYVINTPDRDEDEKEKSVRKVNCPFYVENEAKNYRVGFNSTLHPNYDAFTKDMTWYCALCKNYSHHKMMGDLFGPMFIQKLVLSKKNVPTVMEGQVEASISSPTDTASLPKSKSRKTQRLESADSDNKKGRTHMKTPDRGRLVPPSPRKNNKDADKKGRVSGNLSNESTESKRPPGTECWVHEECLLWCPGPIVVNNKLQGTDEAIITAQESMCHHCNESGATVGCLARGCTLLLHVPCAMLLHWSLDANTFKSYCPLHLDKNKSTAEIS